MTRGPAGGGRRARVSRARRRASRSRTSRASSASCPATRCCSIPTAVATLELFETAAERIEPRLARRDDRPDAHAHGRAAACASGSCARSSTARPSASARMRSAPSSPNPAARDGLGRRLRGVGDLERLTSRAALGLAHARDLVALRGYLGRAAGAAGGPRSARRRRSSPTLAQDITAPPALTKLLDEALEDEPPLTLREGGLIREGWNAELRDFKRSAREARDWIASLERRERERTGIGTPRASASTACSATRSR